MRDVHTFPISGANLIMSMVRLLCRELAHLTRQVIGTSRIHVPRCINWIGRSMPLLMTLQGSLLLIILAIVPDPQEILLEATMTSGGKVTIKST